MRDDHDANCRWVTSKCEYKETHHYCPHPEHACTCHIFNRTESESVSPKAYLGDSVYATWDGSAITLTTENGCGPSNTIVMEPGVVAALEEFKARCHGIP